MSKLSIIIPSRDEKFLVPTIDDIFRNARGEIEVVAVIDSNLWPEDWKETVQRHTPRLHTIFHGTPLGMRRSINDGVASAISRGAKFVAKFDAHCSFSEGFDEILKADCDDDWVVVPRRGRLDPESWTATDIHKPDIDYHYLSFPDDPNDFGGPGLNGKPWNERAVERKDILIDDEMSSQGSGWFMHAEYFTRLGLMDEASYGPFWNEFQEIGLKAWLSGGQVKINKKCRYLHLHKGSKYGRGYRLPESWLKLGRDHTMKWIWNEAWDQRQIRPFSWLINHFWPVPSWPDNWEEVLYAQRKPRAVGLGVENMVRVDGMAAGEATTTEASDEDSQLRIDSARYGVLGAPIPFREHSIDVTERVRSLVKNDSLDIVVNNSTLTPGQNPFRGKKKVLLLSYGYGDGESIIVERVEKDWLIIGSPAQRSIKLPGRSLEAVEAPVITPPDSTATALNDLLRHRFKIEDRRLRTPMPIELRDFHRDDLAKLFAELKFTRGAEIGVAEGHYSETLCKAIPDLELLCVDPWHRYSGNPRAHSKEHQEFSLNETKRKLVGYNAKLIQDFSMNAVRDVKDNSLDFCYIDGHHGFDWAMCDIIEWSKKVRSGGIVAGDDYYHFKWAGVVEAVQAYTQAHQIAIWYVFQGHKSVDFMWVKP